MAFGHYELLDEIGRGGMGVVWRARDTKVGREVALKVLPVDMTKGDMFRVRFEREARTIASLEHSAIVPIYDVGQVNDQPYIAMRLMPGGSLEDRIRKGPMEPEECLPVLQRIGDALDAAHDAGIVHRDIKPGNIIFDGYNAAHLTDFGVVKLAEGEGANLTETGKTLGTPAYMAPEMAQTGAATPQVDVYALGITLYQMLTGQVPFSGTTPVAILMQHIQQPVPTIQRARPDLPASLQNVINAALAKNPANRIQRASDLGRAFAAALEGKQGADLAATLYDPPPAFPVPSELPPSSDNISTVERPAAKRPEPTPRKKKGGGVGLLVIGGGILALAVVLSILAAVVGFVVLPALNTTPEVTTPEATAEPVAQAAPTEPAEPTATFTAVPTATPEPSPDEEAVRAAVEEAVLAYDEEVRYLLQTLDDSRISEVAREQALEDRISAVEILTAAGNCTWRYDHRGIIIHEVTLVSRTEAEVIAEVDRDGTVFCGETERDEFAFTGPTRLYYELDLYSDGWYVTFTGDPEDQEEE
jgi:serine/threonine-protein kinase